VALEARGFESLSEQAETATSKVTDARSRANFGLVEAFGRALGAGDDWCEFVRVPTRRA